MRVDVVPLHLLNDEEAETLDNMNMGSGGRMQRTFREHLGNDHDYAVIAYDDEGFIVGWALLFQDNNQTFQHVLDQYCFFVFVPAVYRRQGVGTALMAASRAVENTPFVIPWNTVSGWFYEKQGNVKVDYFNIWMSPESAAARV